MVLITQSKERKISIRKIRSEIHAKTGIYNVTEVFDKQQLIP
jgi:hypothetical protein